MEEIKQIDIMNNLVAIITEYIGFPNKLNV